MNSLQQITDAWGNWMASGRNTSCRFTSSTSYNDHSELGNYHQYQCSASVQSINYSTSVPVDGSSDAYTLWYDNSSDVTQSENFAYTATSTQSFQWSVTESLSVGVEISATEGVPDVASSTQKVSVTLGLSSTQGQTSTQQQSWTVDTPVQVPAQSSIKCDVIVGTQTYDTNFTQSVLLSGNVAIWFNDKVALDPNDYHWLWFIDIGQVFNDVNSNNLIDTSGYQVTNGGVLATCSGTFSGGQGVNVQVQTHQYPLRNSGQQMVDKAKAISSKKILQGAIAAE